MRNRQWIVGILVLPLAFMLWWNVAANYDYSSLAGAYVLRDGAATYVLHLGADQTYMEKLETKSGASTVRGTWHRFGESAAEFYAPFLRVPGQQAGPSGENYGHFEKDLGIFPTLTLDPYPGGPKFRRTVRSFFERN
jgi:hypothetical protein